MQKYNCVIIAANGDTMVLESIQSIQNEASGSWRCQRPNSKTDDDAIDAQDAGRPSKYLKSLHLCPLIEIANI